MSLPAPVEEGVLRRRPSPVESTMDAALAVESHHRHSVDRLESTHGHNVDIESTIGTALTMGHTMDTGVDIEGLP